MLIGFERSLNGMNRLLVGMKKNLIFWTILLTIFLSGCGNSSAKKVVDKYFSAVKSGDFDKAIECFSPAMQSQLEASKALADSLFNVDSGAIFNGLVGIVNPQEYADYEFKPVSETIIDDTHTAVIVEIKTGGSIDTTEVNCIKIDGQWYIE